MTQRPINGVVVPFRRRGTGSSGSMQGECANSTGVDAAGSLPRSPRKPATDSAILIVDDEPGIRELLTWELKAEGYEVQTASDGVEALRLMSRVEFDLVISDVRMPRVDGLEVLRTTKQTSPDTEVIIATGYAELEYAVECVRQGAFDFIQKPFRTASLLTTVTRALERRRLRQTTELYQASRVILDGQEPQNLPQTIVQLAMQAMEADDASLLLPDAEGNLRVAHSQSLSPQVERTARIGISEGVAGMIAALREPVLIANGIASDQGVPILLPAGRVQSSIVYPLLTGDRLAGALCINRISNARPYRNADLDRAAVLASQVLLALENSRLLREAASSERLASVGLLATGVAHEINNPAACVLANHSYLQDQLSVVRELSKLIDSTTDVELLRREWTRAGGSQLVANCQDALSDLGLGASRIRDIARDMTSLGRNDATKLIEFDVNDAVRSALRITAAELRHRAAVRTDLADGLLVMGSPGRVSQIFVNLLLNATQAIAELGEEQAHEIIVRSRCDETHVFVTVRDDGPGIRPEHATRIFDNFFTTKNSGVGTGLGLPISRDIAQSYGGDLRLEPSTEGATFVVSFPLAEVARNTRTNLQEKPLPPIRQGLTILCVDDEPHILKSYKRFFGSEHDLVVANDGEEALKVLEQQTVDLIICDLLMPKMSGMELYRMVKARRPELQRRFIFVSGGLMQHDVRAFLEEVDNEVLEKPFAFSKLRDVIGKQIQLCNFARTSIGR